MNACLNEILCGNRVLIGIRDYADCADPESGLMINDLPGMSLKVAAAIASEEYQTGANLLKEKIKLATKLVVNDFTSLVSGDYDFNAILKIRQVNNFKDNALAKVAKERGLVIKRWRSELAQIFIENIYIRSDDSGIAVLKVIDGPITKSYEVSVAANTIMQVRLDYRAQSEVVKIVIDNTNFSMYTGQMNNAGTCGTCSGPSSDLYITGWDGEEESAFYYGIGVDASVRCYEDNAMCKLIPRAYFLIWYKAGIEICKEHLQGNRMNNIATFGKDKAKELKEALEKEYLKAQKDFAVNIKTYLRALRTDCLTCNNMQYVQSTP